MPQKITTIRLDEATKIALRKFKNHKRETDEDLLKRIIEEKLEPEFKKPQG